MCVCEHILRWYQVVKGTFSVLCVVHTIVFSLPMYMYTFCVQNTCPCNMYMYVVTVLMVKQVLC